MRTRPILFNGEMVRAILDGRKTQTRRVIIPQPFCEIPGAYFDAYNGGPQWNWWTPDGRVINTHGIVLCPFEIGGRRWVRETWGVAPCFDGIKPSKIPLPHPRQVSYRADLMGDAHRKHMRKWRPSIFMPRWASRLLLDVTGIRVERVQDISVADIIAEGFADISSECDLRWARAAFYGLWDSINAKRGWGWQKNPWVWVVDFKRVV